MQETWVNIEGYNGFYQISNMGRIKSVPRKIHNYTSKERFLRPALSNKHLVVALCKNGKTKMFRVENLVALYFVENPNMYKEIIHKDGNLYNNSADNLMWYKGKHNRAQDFIGKKFGHLTLLSANKEKNHNGQYVHKCVCDCGNISYKTLYGLISGHDKSCGDCKNVYEDRKVRGNRIKDITGKQFGRLTAIRVVGNDRYGRKKWLFKCDCGNQIVCSANNVISGNTKSCGCLKHHPSPQIDLTGQKFGRLTVIGMSKNKKKGVIMWDCVCDCGNLCSVKTSSLRRGETKSCGCILEEIQVKSNGANAWAINNKKTFEYKCAHCGRKENLHSHHILPKNKYPQYAKDDNNGITLCNRCHKEFHKLYGNDCNAYNLAEYLGLPSMVGDIITNVVEFRDKNGKEDLIKAKHCIDMLIELEYGSKK